MDIYSWVASFFSIVYVLLAVRNTKWCFVFGFISSGIWGLADFSVYNLKFDGFLQVFYMIMSIAGWIKWSLQDYIEVDTNISNIKHFSTIANISIIIVGTILSLIMVMFLQYYTTTTMPYLDAMTTVFSIIATFMLIYRYIDSWIYLLVCDIAYIYIYITQSAYVLSVMMVIYTVMALMGYINWKKKMNPNIN